MGRRSALEFVLLDRRFPRSVFQAMNAAEHSLAELEAAGANTLRRPAP